MMEFLDKIKNDPTVMEMIKKLPVPNSEEEALAGYQSVAKQLGFDLPKEDMIAALKAFAEEQRAKTDKIALNEENLENVAGGGVYETCASTYTPDEWCWFSDSCDVLISSYSDDKKYQKIDKAFGQEFDPNDEDDENAPNDPFDFDDIPDAQYFELGDSYK